MSEILAIRKRAHELVQSGELDRALEEYEKLLKMEEVDPNIYNLIGDVYYKKGCKDEAFAKYREAVDRYRSESLYSNAIAVCRKMLRLDPDYVDALAMLGDLFLDQGFGSEAAGYFLEYAQKLLESGRKKEAADALKKVIETAPGKVQVREQLAKVYLEMGLADEARSELIAASEVYLERHEKEKAQELKRQAESIEGAAHEEEAELRFEGETSDRVEIVHKRIGLAHHVPLRIEEVFASFKEEVKKAIGEEDYESHYDLGMAYLDLGFYDEALKEFGIARKSKELALKSIEMAGRCFLEKGDIELAIEELTSALELGGYSQNDYLGIKYTLAQAYEKIDQVDKAIELYQEVYNTDSSFRDAGEKVKEIGKRS